MVLFIMYSHPLSSILLKAPYQTVVDNQ